MTARERRSRERALADAWARVLRLTAVVFVALAVGMLVNALVLRMWQPGVAAVALLGTVVCCELLARHWRATGRFTYDGRTGWLAAAGAACFGVGAVVMSLS